MRDRPPEATYIQTDKRTRAKKNQAEVSRAEVALADEHEDEAADNGDGQRVEVEPEAVLHAVGEHGVAVGVEDGEDVRRRDEEQGDDSAVAQC